MKTDPDQQEEAEDDYLEGWEHDDLAPRLASVPAPALRSAIQSGSLMTFLRSRLGEPPREADRPVLMLDSPEAEEHGRKLTEDGDRVTEMLTGLNSREIDQVIASLREFDPTEALAEALEGLRPADR